jgi:dTDP-4-amino-4,6-dideoxygalactose transaminase
MGVKHVVGVANGTDAILLTLAAMGIGRGDEVIIPANTFIATAEAIVHAGARAVLVDVDPLTYTIDVDQLESRITSRTRAIIAVHLYGLPADMRPILALAEKHGCDVIEDAAQAHGAEYEGRKIGSWGRAACFSFYPAKNLGAYGDAGAVATNDDRLALALRKLRDHGGVEKYRHDLVGFNSRLDTLQAAVLQIKLRHLDRWNVQRREHASRYHELLSPIQGLVPPAVPPDRTHVYHLYVVRVEQGRREELQAYLGKHGVQTGIHYPTPLHQIGALAPWLGAERAFPAAERCACTILSLPMYPELTQAQIEFVAEHVGKYMAIQT